MRDISLRNWIATRRWSSSRPCGYQANATAKIGQTSLLGTQHVELAAPPILSPQPLKSGDTIGLAWPNSTDGQRRVTTGGGTSTSTIQTEILNIL